MIKIKDGSTRIAIILFKWLVIKIPKLRTDMMILEKWKINNIPEILYLSFVYGFSANSTEALIYEICECRTRKKTLGTNSPLTPVFSIGIANFQIYQGENIPTEAEIIEFIKKLHPSVLQRYLKCDSHDVSNHNWRKTKKGLMIIDYGGQSQSADQLSFFLQTLVIKKSQMDMRCR